MSNSLIDLYITRCKVAEHPLSRTQINMLEEVVNEVLLGKEPSKPELVPEPIETPRASELFDRQAFFSLKDKIHYEHIGFLESSLLSYRKAKYGVDVEKPLSDQDALNYYNALVNLSPKEKRRLQQDLSLSKLPSAQGLKIFHQYLVNRGLIKGEMPQPIKDPPTPTVRFQYGDFDRKTLDKVATKHHFTYSGWIETYIRQYRQSENGIPQDKPLTNKDAMELYKAALLVVDRSDYSTAKLEKGIPVHMGKTAVLILRDYLKTKKMIK